MNFEHINLEICDCPLCGENQFKFLFQGRDLLHNLPGEYSVVKCLNCQFIFTNPRPTPETIGFYYPKNYGPYILTSISTSNDWSRRPWWKRQVRKLLGGGDISYVQALPKQLLPGRALEFGCASGGYLDSLVKSGWIVEGVEFDSEAAANARIKGHNVYTGSLESSPDPIHKYDLVVGWMVLEHLHQPKKCLERLNQWVEDDGWLVLSVPDASYFGFKMFKDYEYGLQLPAHLSHFTPKTITHILELTGWSVEKIHHQRVLGSISGSIGLYLRDRCNINNRFVNSLIEYDKYYAWLNNLLFPIAMFLAFFGQTGRMTVWAQKRSK